MMPVLGKNLELAANCSYLIMTLGKYLSPVDTFGATQINDLVAFGRAPLGSFFEFRTERLYPDHRDGTQQ
jgi:hypothetical protein